MSPRSRLALLATGTVLAAVALTGCTAGDGDGEATPTPTATEAAEVPDAAVTEITDTPGSVEGYVGAAADAEQRTCELADGAWTVDGTVTNPTDAAQHYRLYVSLQDGDQQTRGLTQVDVERVEPGASAEWSTSVAVPDEGLSCLLRVERFAA